MAPFIGFDLYGTLLSTESIANQLEQLYGKEAAQSLAAQARRYQLEYTWRANSMGVFKPFDELTRASFRHATREAGISMSSSDEEQIMDAYNALSPFPDALPGLDLLSQTPSAAACIFSNGTTDMVTSSAQAAKIGLTRAVTVEAVGVYKPDVRTYEHLVKEAQRESSRSKEEVWVVSSNPFDVLGAVSAGLRSCWVDRTGKGWVDGLGEAVGLEPSLVVGGVDEAVRAILGTGRGKEEKGQGS